MSVLPLLYLIPPGAWFRERIWKRYPRDVVCFHKSGASRPWPRRRPAHKRRAHHKEGPRRAPDRGKVKKAKEIYEKSGSGGTNAAVIGDLPAIDEGSVDKFWNMLDEMDEEDCQMIEGLSEAGTDVMASQVRVSEIRNHLPWYVAIAGLAVNWLARDRHRGAEGIGQRAGQRTF